MSGERDVQAAKENLLRQIGHLRRTVDYDYPPDVVSAHLRSVRAAAKANTDAWLRRARENR